MKKTFFSSLDELKEGFDCNMEYDIKLDGREYYIVFFFFARNVSFQNYSELLKTLTIC